MNYKEFLSEAWKTFTIIEMEAAQEWLRKHAIGTKTAARVQMGFDRLADPERPGAGPEINPCIVLPMKDQAGFIYIDIKSDEERPVGHAEGLLTDQTNGQPLFIAGNALDALALIEAGVNVAIIKDFANVDELIKLNDAGTTSITAILAYGKKDAAKAADLAKKASVMSILLCSWKTESVWTALNEDKNVFSKNINEWEYVGRVNQKTNQEAAANDETERTRRTGAGMIDEFLKAAQTRRYEPLPTGIKDIDNAIGGGFIRQQLVILGAAPGAGKTALAQWIFEGMAERGATCIYLNLEMSAEQMIARSLARILPKYGEEMSTVELLQGYKWTDEQKKAVLAAGAEYKETTAPRMIYNPAGMTSDLDGIMAYLEDEARWKEEAGLPAPIVCIDYLQILSGREREDGTELIKRAVLSFKRFAVDHNTVVFAIIAHNRDSNKSGNVAMESARDTSNIEYSADLQMGLVYTACLSRNGEKGIPLEELNRPENKEKRQFRTLVITKGRFAEPGTQVDLTFDGKSMTFHQTEKPPAGWSRTTATPPDMFLNGSRRRNDGRI